MADETDLRAAAKEAAGRHAAGFVEDGMRVGLGTGSTVHWTIVELGDRVQEGLTITCTATSVQTHELATSLGIRVLTPDEIGSLDIAIDGADEVDPAFNLTKGGGGAHTREKVVAEMAARFIVVVDESKLVDHLGPFGTPLEVLDFAPGVVRARVLALGASEVIPRLHPGDGGHPTYGRSDNGNLLMDARFGSISDPAALAGALDTIPGVVAHGIFLAGMVERVVVASRTAGVTELVRRPD